jgi:MFS family permease
VLAGGIVAAFVGPELAVKTRDLLPPVGFLGSYLTLAVLGVVAIGLASFLRIPDLTAAERRDSGRPLLQIMRQRTFIVAVITSMIGYAVMSFTMTATPLAMVACGFQHVQAGTVIQWHVLGMFAPSFFTGHLIARFGLYRVMLVGAILLSVSAGIAVAGVDFANFWAALLIIGVGWNFLFVGATTLLTQAHTPAERAKTQAANDFLVFASTATASFLSGKLLYVFGWETINLLTLPFALASAVLVLWFALQARRAPKHA